MDLKLKTTVTFTFESVENYEEEWLEYNEGPPEVMRDHVFDWHNTLVARLNNCADNCLPRNYTIETKTEEYWRDIHADVN